MQLARSDQMVLAGVLRFAMRFDALPAADRTEALACAAEELGLRATEVRLVARQRAGYRDAAAVLAAASTELDALLAAASREIPDDRALRARIGGVADERARLAIVRAVEIVARHGGLTRAESLFLDWLCEIWGIAPVASDG